MTTFLRLKDTLRFLLLCTAILGLHTEGFAQATLPAGTTYTQTFDGIGSGLPSGWTVRSGASASSRGTSQTFTTTAFSWGDTGGAFKNFAASEGLAAGAATGVQSASTDRALGARPSGSFGDPGLAFEFAIANTTDKTAFSLDMKHQILDSQGRSITWSVQYSVNAGAAWTTVGTFPDPGSFGSTSATYSFGSALDNKSGNVLIRVANLAASTNSGSRDSYGIDDFVLSWTNAPAASTASDIIADAGFTPTSNIDYNNYQTAVSLTDANSIEVGRFTIRDGGATTDADALATVLNAISFTVANPGSLRALAIFDGTTNVGEITTVGATASFTGLTLSAADGATKTFSVRATFKNAVTDNQQFSLTVATTTASGTGSAFAAANAGAATTSVAGDANRIEVTASLLLFNVQPSTTQINVAIAPAVTVTALDVLANFDTDYTGTVNLTTTGTFAGGATTSAAAVSGTATFNNIIFSAPGTGLTLEASAAGLASTGNSSTFVVTNPEPEINVMQNAANIASGASFAIGDLVSGTTGAAVTFTVQNTGNANLTIASVTSGNTTDFTLNTSAVTSPVSGSGSTTFTVTFHPTTQGAKSTLITINNNDSNEGTYTFTLTGNGTVSTASNIIYNSAFTTTSDIAYGNYQTASGLTAANSVNAAGFILQDGSGSADSDNLGTTLTGVTFTVAGTAAAQIRTAALFDAGVNIAEVAVNGSTTIAFNGLNVSAADGGSHNFELHVTLLGTVTDNTQFGFTVASATASVAESAFVTANAGGAASSTAGDVNRIEVVGTNLVFVQQPANTLVGATMSPAVVVAARDTNGKTDLDFTGNVTITSTGTLAASQNATASAGIATFNAISFSAAGTARTLQADAAGYTAATSSAFDVTIQAAGELLFEDNFTYSGNLTANGYTVTGSAATPVLSAGAAGLSYTNYGSTNVGNGLSMSNSGQDVNHTFAEQGVNSTTYASALVNVSAAQATGDYFIHLGPTVMASEFRGRVYVRLNGANIQFGVSTTGTTVVYSNTNYALNTTYLIVLKQNYTSTTATSSLFINPSVTSEPATADATQSTATVVTNIGSIGIRQGNSSNAATLRIDGIRVATNWGAALGNPQYDTTSVINAGNYNSVSVLDGTLTAGGAITVNNAIQVTDGADFVIPNNVNLIQKGTANTNTGAITVKRNATMKRLDYVYWGSPVSGQDLKLFSPYTVSQTNAPGYPTPTGSSRFYTLNETTNAFQVISEPLGVSFDVAKGYMLRAPNNFPSDNTTTAVFNGSFNGVPHNGDITVNVTANGSGMNLLSNPYPSTINADLFLDNNPTLESLYFWTHPATPSNVAGANYATYNSVGAAAPSGTTPPSATPNGTIQVGQGFIAKTTSAATISYSNSLRVNNTAGQFFRGVANEKNRIWLNLSKGDSQLNQILTGYVTDATNELDNKFDAKLIETNGSKLYNLVNNSEYVIQGRALPFNAEDVVALGFKADAAGNYTISIDHVDGLFSEGQAIFIKDQLTGVTHNVTEGAYTFASEAGVFNGRFQIVYQNVTLGTENPALDANSVIVFTKGNTLNINSGNVEMQAVKVFDIRGRLMFEQKGINATQTSITTLKATQQVLIVQVTANNATISKKVVY